MLEFLTVAIITVLAVISPGPDFAMVTRNALVTSRKAGMLTAVGIALGVWVHITYAVLGFGLIIQNSIVLFNVIKIAGALYLIYLGVKMLRTKAGTAIETGASPASPLTSAKALQMGFLTNILNPRTTIFIVSLFAQIIDPETSLETQIGYGAFIAGAHLVLFALVALLFSNARVQQSLLRIRHHIDRAFGALLTAFGGLILTDVLRRG